MDKRSKLSDIKTKLRKKDELLDLQTELMILELVKRNKQ